MKNLFLNRKWLTLIELVVVLTILAILPTIAFYSYTSSLVDSRDAYRITQLNNLYESLKYYKNTKELPLPDNYLEVRVNWTVVAYQWYIWTGTLKTISYKWKSDTTIDPKDKKYYNYYLSKDRKYFQLMTYLEKSSNFKVSMIEQTNALNAYYFDRFPFFIWDKIWIITEVATNTPINEINLFAIQGYVNFTWSLLWTYKLNFSQNDSFSSTNNWVVWTKINTLLKIVDTKIIN